MPRVTGWATVRWEIICRLAASSGGRATTSSRRRAGKVRGRNMPLLHCRCHPPCRFAVILVNAKAILVAASQVVAGILVAEQRRLVEGCECTLIGRAAAAAAAAAAAEIERCISAEPCEAVCEQLSSLNLHWMLSSCRGPRKMQPTAALTFQSVLSAPGRLKKRVPDSARPRRKTSSASATRDMSALCQPITWLLMKHAFESAGPGVAETLSWSDAPCVVMHSPTTCFGLFLSFALFVLTSKLVIDTRGPLGGVAWCASQPSRQASRCP